MQSNFMRGYLLVLAATAIWSGNFIVARGLSNSIPPVTLAFLRWSIAVLVLFPFAIRHLYRDIGIVKKHLGYISLTAFLGVTTFNTMVYIAARNIQSFEPLLDRHLFSGFSGGVCKMFLGRAFYP